MTNLTITCIIGTNNIGAGADEVEGAEAYRTELAEKLTEKFPNAKRVDVVIENGNSKALVGGCDWDEEDAMVSTITDVANDVWNSGDWHNA